MSCLHGDCQLAGCSRGLCNIRVRWRACRAGCNRSRLAGQPNKTDALDGPQEAAATACMPRKKAEHKDTVSSSNRPAGQTRNKDTATLQNLCSIGTSPKPTLTTFVLSTYTSPGSPCFALPLPNPHPPINTTSSCAAQPSQHWRQPATDPSAAWLQLVPLLQETRRTHTRLPAHTSCSLSPGEKQTPLSAWARGGGGGLADGRHLTSGRLTSPAAWSTCL